MSLTPYFELKKVAKTDGYDISDFNDNMDTIDTEMHKPPLTVNNASPDANRNISLTSVPLADNLTSDEAQIVNGTFIVRTSGGGASIDNGSAFLSAIIGNMVKTGYSPEEYEMNVTNVPRTNPDDEEISATIIIAEFREAVSNTSGTYTFVFSTSWNNDPALYGITVTGTPIAGDTIVVVFVKENRGTITVANPLAFISTGWNLYEHDESTGNGVARVCRYSETYGYKITGTYRLIEYSPTLTGARTQIVPVSGSFNVPGDGWLFITGGSASDTELWATWSDWTEQANGGTFEAYTEDEIDLSGVMANFPDGLMRIGNVYDEINLNTGIAYARIARLDYTTYIAEVKASGQAYDTDTNYVYVVRGNSAIGNIPGVAVYDASSIDGDYTVNDHGMEYYTNTAAPVGSQSLYGQDLKNKLRRDVLTISEQTLTDPQKEQVQKNIGVDTAIDNAKAEVFDVLDGMFKIVEYSYSKSVASATNFSMTAEDLGITDIEGYTPIGFVSFTFGGKSLCVSTLNPILSGTVITGRNLAGSTQTAAAKVRILWVKNRTIEKEE